MMRFVEAAEINLQRTLTRLGMLAWQLDTDAVGLIIIILL